MWQDSTVKDLYAEVAKYTGENEDNFELKLNSTLNPLLYFLWFKR